MKNVLLIVDPQNDFIEGGALPVTGGTKALDNLIEFYADHKDLFEQVFVTMDTHPENHCSFKDNGGEWPPHCVDSTSGWEVYKPLSESLINDSYFLKGTDPKEDEYSIFSKNCKDGKELITILDNLSYEAHTDLNIYIAGIAGDYCVLNTIKDLIRLHYGENLIVLTNCIASIDGGDELSNCILENNLKTL